MFGDVIVAIISGGVMGLSMGAAKSAGGVMGKMIEAQSIAVASTATEWYGIDTRATS
jgi:lactate permease